MHILTENLRSDAHRTNGYASASVLAYRTNCTPANDSSLHVHFATVLGTGKK